MKLKLIRPFASYPVGEYVLESERYYSYLKHHFIHKDIVEKFKDHFEEIKERPTSWEALVEINGFRVCGDSTILGAEEFKTTNIENKNMFITKKQAEASLALAQITQLLDRYDIPEISEDWYHKNGMYLSSGSSADKIIKRQGLFRFDTAEKRDHFYKHHQALIDKLKPFYIF